MALLQSNDISIHEAGHVLICYLMSDLIELYSVTVDEEFSKTIDKNSDGGLLYKYIKYPKLLHFLDLDQFCLLNLGGLAADIINEHDGKVENEFFSTKEFIKKIEHYNYQGDMIAFNDHFAQIYRRLKVSPQYYNHNSITLLTNMFSNDNILQNLLGIREIIADFKTVKGKILNDFLDQSYFKEYKFYYWEKIKEARKELFSI